MCFILFYIISFATRMYCYMTITLKITTYCFNTIYHKQLFMFLSLEPWWYSLLDHFWMIMTRLYSLEDNERQNEKSELRSSVPFECTCDRTCANCSKLGTQRQDPYWHFDRGKRTYEMNKYVHEAYVFDVHEYWIELDKIFGVLKDHY